MMLCRLTSVAYIGPKSRRERPRKTRIGTEVAHVTRDSDTTFKVKGQGHQAALLTAVLARQAAAAVSVGTYCYVAVCKRGGRLGGARHCAHRGRSGAGAYRGGRPPTACYFVFCTLLVIVYFVYDFINI